MKHTSQDLYCTTATSEMITKSPTHARGKGMDKKVKENFAADVNLQISWTS